MFVRHSAVTVAVIVEEVVCVFGCGLVAEAVRRHDHDVALIAVRNGRKLFGQRRHRALTQKTVHIHDRQLAGTEICHRRHRRRFGRRFRRGGRLGFRCGKRFAFQHRFTAVRERGERVHVFVVVEVRDKQSFQCVQLFVVEPFDRLAAGADAVFALGFGNQQQNAVAVDGRAVFIRHGAVAVAVIIEEIIGVFGRAFAIEIGGRHNDQIACVPVSEVDKPTRQDVRLGGGQKMRVVNDRGFAGFGEIHGRFGRCEDAVRRVEICADVVEAGIFVFDGAVGFPQHVVADAFRKYGFRDRTLGADVVQLRTDRKHHGVRPVGFGLFIGDLTGQPDQRRVAVVLFRIGIINRYTAQVRDFLRACVEIGNLGLCEVSFGNVDIRLACRVRRDHGTDEQQRDQQERKNAFHRQPPPHPRKCPATTSPARMPANSSP